ncbi:MAG: PepSY domain-containing protein [Marinosulfonomonas sp.]
MNTKLIFGSTLAGLALAGGIAGMVSAQSAADTTGLTEEQIIAIALEEVPGEVTDVEQESHRGKQVYEVEIMAADGTEKEVKISAETGKLLKVKAGGDDCDKHNNDRDYDGDGDDA